MRLRKPTFGKPGRTPLVKRPSFLPAKGRPIVGRPMFGRPRPVVGRPGNFPQPQPVVSTQVEMESPSTSLMPSGSASAPIVGRGGSASAPETDLVPGQHPGIVDDSKDLEQAKDETPFYKKPAVLIGGGLLVLGLIYLGTRKKNK